MVAVRLGVVIGLTPMLAIFPLMKSSTPLPECFVFQDGLRMWNLTAGG